MIETEEEGKNKPKKKPDGVPRRKRSKREHEKELEQTAEWRKKFWGAEWNALLDGYGNPEDDL
jgi:hypothetical protein